jgi:DNA-binding transcriptional regulator YdaS (Cro superfamily)
MIMKAARLDLDFSAARHTGPLGWLLLAIGATLAALAIVELQSAQASLRAVSSELQSANGRIASSVAPVRAGPAIDPRVSKAANQVARELQVPWAEMLASLEAVPTPDIALLGVEPSAQRHVLRITAEAKNAASMLDYLDALRVGRQFSDVWLLSHQVELQTPGTPTRFIVQLKWSGR